MGNQKAQLVYRPVRGSRRAYLLLKAHFPLEVLVFLSKRALHACIIVMRYTIVVLFSAQSIASRAPPTGVTEYSGAVFPSCSTACWGDFSMGGIGVRVWACSSRMHFCKMVHALRRISAWRSTLWVSCVLTQDPFLLNGAPFRCHV